MVIETIKLDSVAETDYCSFGLHKKTWISAFDDKGDDILIRGEQIDIVSSDLDSLLSYLEKSIEIRLSIYKKEADTLYVEIVDDDVYTQQLGTTGANMTRNVIIYTLTEYQDFNTVFLKFEEGDHGGLSTYYSRSDIDEDIRIFYCSN